MNRRQFTKTSIMGTVALGLKGLGPDSKSHIVTLSFDDGFKKSFFKIASIHEEYGLHACLNVLAAGHFSQFDDDILGNFDDWNTLKERGHEIMPHGWEHQHLTEIPEEKAQALIEKCLAGFEENLNGFITSKAVFNFPYNASNPGLEDFVLKRVRAVRTGGWNLGNETAINPVPGADEKVRIACQSYGPEIADDWVEQQMTSFLSGEGGWLVLNLHGVDGEGWGPVSSKYLSALLKRLVNMEKVAVMPAGEVLDEE